MNLTRTHLKRALAASVLGSAFVAATAGVASAHTNGSSATCQGGVHALATQFSTTDLNSIIVLIDGAKVGGAPNFGPFFEGVFLFPQDGGQHAWAVIIDSTDNTWDSNVSGVVGPCGEPTTTQGTTTSSTSTSTTTTTTSPTTTSTQVTTTSSSTSTSTPTTVGSSSTTTVPTSSSSGPTTSSTSSTSSSTAPSTSSPRISTTTGVTSTTRPPSSTPTTHPPTLPATGADINARLNMLVLGGLLIVGGSIALVAAKRNR